MLTDKVVIVSGAGGGVGAEIAKMAAANGACVVVNDLGGSSWGEGADSSPADQTVEAIRAAGGKAAPSYRSIAEWDSAHGVIQDALDAFGRIDAVINNAGILRDVIFHKMTQEDWDLVVNVNLSGYFYVSRAAATHFKAQESGSFVHMTSASGLIGNRGQANYSAAKLGVAALSKSIALDMQRFNVRSNCIAPFAFTRMAGTIPDTEENRARLVQARKMTPDKVAPLACALVSDGAADVNGQIFSSRMNEIALYSQHRPVRSTQVAEGWTPQTVLSHALPAMKAHFSPLDVSSQVFSWDPY